MTESKDEKPRDEKSGKPNKNSGKVDSPPTPKINLETESMDLSQSASESKESEKADGEFSSEPSKSEKGNE